MKPPIILQEGDDFGFYESLAHFQQSFEPVDAEAQDAAYDSEGRLLRLRVIGGGFWSLRGKQVVVEEAESEPAHASELRDKLFAFLASTGVPRDWLAAHPSLEDLVKKGLEVSAG